MGIREKLSVIQQELIAPKNQYNEFGKYKYRSCEDILEGLKPCLKKVGAVVTITDDIVMIGGRFYVKATASLKDTESEGSISCTAFAREEEVKKSMDSSQVTGSASSYARKYALNGLFCIDDVKDVDTRDNTKKEEVQTEKIENSVISEEKVKALIARCEASNIQPAKITELYKVSSLADLTEKKYANINKNWEKIVSA